MKTAVQELIEYMDLIAVPKELDKDIQSALTQFHTYLMYKINDLLEKEKQQMSNAMLHGWRKALDEDVNSIDLNDFYNQTYK